MTAICYMIKILILRYRYRYFKRCTYICIQCVPKWSSVGKNDDDQWRQNKRRKKNTQAYFRHAAAIRLIQTFISKANSDCCSRLVQILNRQRLQGWNVGCLPFGSVRILDSFLEIADKRLRRIDKGRGAELMLIPRTAYAWRHSVPRFLPIDFALIQRPLERLAASFYYSDSIHNSLCLYLLEIFKVCQT